MKPKITWGGDFKNARIYINDILHIHFNKDNYISLQSWYNGSKKNKIFTVEITFKESTLLMEYVDYETWVEILRLLDDNL
jgi:hypothetical protein